jgi:hypothetical protein
MVCSRVNFTYFTLRSINHEAPPHDKARGGAMVVALRYKPEGREIDSRWCHWNFSFT